MKTFALLLPCSRCAKRVDVLFDGKCIDCVTGLRQDHARDAKARAVKMAALHARIELEDAMAKQGLSAAEVIDLIARKREGEPT